MTVSRWDIVHAHWLFARWNYVGQGDPLYARLCRIGSYYRVSDQMADRFENWEQLDVYRALEEKHGKPVRSACLCCSRVVARIGLCDPCEFAGCGPNDLEPCQVDASESPDLETEEDWRHE